MSAGPAAPGVRHVGIILDGNRRWARRHHLTVAQGHAAGFAKVPEVVQWADDLGIEVLTLWMLSVENLERSAAEVADLFTIIAATVDAVDEQRLGTVRHVGRADLLPGHLRERLDAAARAQGRPGPLVNLAVAYSGRHEIVEAVRAACLHEASITEPAHVAERLAPELVDAHVPTGCAPVDLIVRTSGEHRSSGFLMWAGQDAHLHVEQSMWPDFERRHLERALRAHRARHTRREDASA